MPRSRSHHRRVPALAVALAALALAAAASAEGEYAGQDTCLVCHEDVMTHYGPTLHAKLLGEAEARNATQRLGCEACHGPGAAHADEAGGAPIRSFRAENSAAITDENGACLDCHERGARLHWEGSAHASRDVACTSCHAVKEQRSPHGLLKHATQTETCTSCHLMQRAKLFRNAHMPVREGAMTCSSCHNAHGSVAEALLSHDTVNDTCYSCHADKRGPLLWEHAPVRENCLNCHDPHGSVRENMLVLSQPRLCQSCHVAALHPGQPRVPSSRFVLSRSCAQCHKSVHGSNHPSGAFLTR